MRKLSLLLVLALTCLTGCLGTLGGRSIHPAPSFGKPLWHTTAMDIKAVGAAIDGEEFPSQERGYRAFVLCAGSLSVVGDFAADTALLPVDLIAMCFGLSKIPPPRKGQLTLPQSVSASPPND